jgi:hypothetical protein
MKPPYVRPRSEDGPVWRHVKQRMCHHCLFKTCVRTVRYRIVPQGCLAEQGENCRKLGRGFDYNDGRHATVRRGPKRTRAGSCPEKVAMGQVGRIRWSSHCLRPRCPLRLPWRPEEATGSILVIGCPAQDARHADKRRLTGDTARGPDQRGKICHIFGTVLVYTIRSHGRP